MAKKVTIRGKALDAKAGAVIMVDGSGPVYIEWLQNAITGKPKPLSTF
jgi:hypothetical protein